VDEWGRADLHKKLVDRFGARGEALYMFVLGFIAISVNGLVAWTVGLPLLFPSLAPTIFLVFRTPLAKEASPRNTIEGHFIGILLGMAGLAAFGLLDTPSILQEGVTLAHIGAAALSLALTEAGLILLNRPHTPAATTTLLVGLGVFETQTELISLVAGIVLLTVTMWLFNRILGVPVPLWSPREQPESG
jgi:CDP-diglyceride synthetase